MSSSRHRLVILALDGVITQTATVHARAWKRVLDNYLSHRNQHKGEKHQPFDLIRDYRQYLDGKSHDDGVRSFLESRGIHLHDGSPNDAPDEHTISGLCNRKKIIFYELLKEGGAQVYNDALEQINFWKRQGLKVAVIASSKNDSEVLCSAHIDHLFDVKLDANIRAKPALDVFLEAARQMGVASSDAMIVETSVSGIQAGRAGKFNLVVGVARGCAGEDLKAAGADVIVHDLRELRGLAHSPPGENCLCAPCSAIKHLDWMASHLRHNDIAIFLDYDGTLTPIVRRPEEALLAEQMRALLSQLSRQCVVGIISGRDRQDVEQMVQLDHLIYAGSHGFDITGPDLHMTLEEASLALPELDDVEQSLVEKLARIAGARVERKKFAIAIHYREVESPRDMKRVEQVLDTIVAAHPSLKKKGGKKIFELLPDVDWDKGQALLWLRHALSLDQEEIQLIYIGDDVTDEDAFSVLRQHGLGIPIRVERSNAGTRALYWLKDCQEVKQFLHALLAITSESSADGSAGSQVGELSPE